MKALIFFMFNLHEFNKLSIYVNRTGLVLFKKCNFNLNDQTLYGLLLLNLTFLKQIKEKSVNSYRCIKEGEKVTNKLFDTFLSYRTKKNTRRPK